MVPNVYVVIMAGGGGTRFWPYSREEKPKQFLDILGVGKSLLQLTYQRFLGYVKEENIKIITLQKYENTVKEQLPHLQKNQIILEPNRKNTATCILYACYKIYKECKDAILIIVPVDHLIMDEKAFQKCLNTAIEHVFSSQHIITIGIQPTREETGYGYIQYIENKQSTIHKVKTFVEKPNISFVKKFIESKEFVWNAGIFISKADSLIEEYQKFYPEIGEIFFNVSPFFDTDTEQEKLTSLYSLCKNISIDFALMEKSDEVYVILGDFVWIDIGTWNTLYQYGSKDEQKNTHSANPLILKDSEENIIYTDTRDKLIVLEGIKNHLIADYGNVLVIIKKENEEYLKDILADLAHKELHTYL